MGETKALAQSAACGDEASTKAASGYWHDGRRTPENGCCSAIEPCAHQQRSPNTLCATCRSMDDGHPETAVSGGDKIDLHDTQDDDWLVEWIICDTPPA